MTAIELSRDDFSTIFSDDIELTDIRYSGPLIYKYYYFADSKVQRAFFAKPSIKFTHKDDLDDPFELSRRWQKFGCPFTKEIFDKYVRKRFEDQITDVGVITKEFRNRANRSGIYLSRQQIRRWLLSREGLDGPTVYSLEGNAALFPRRLVDRLFCFGA